MAWKLITGAFLLASVAFAGDCTPGEAGASCMTSGGSWLTIISPFANSNAVVGQDLTVTWGVCGNDPSFLYGNVTFEIADATNPNNVQTISGGQIISSTPVSVGTVTVKVPLTLAATATGKYTIKSSYRDDVAKKWVSCFGNTFTITGGAAPQNASATVVPGKTSGKESMTLTAAVALLTGALML